MEDKLLVLRSKRGSRQALRRIYQKYRDDLLILAVALLNDVNTAEDVVHDVFVVFTEGLAKFELTGSLKSYLATCVANRARNLRQSKQYKTVGLEQVGVVVSDAAGPANSIICNEELRRLASAMAQLPTDQQDVIALHIHGRMRFRAIAESQGISTNTAKSRYRYGIGKLRSILDGQVKK